MSLLSRLFGGGGGSKAPPEPESIDHKGFKITPAPINEGGVFRIGAKIEKDVDGQMKTHDLIRADTLNDPDAAATASVDKAKQLIDQMGDRLFN